MSAHSYMGGCAQGRRVGCQWSEAFDVPSETGSFFALRDKYRLQTPRSVFPALGVTPFSDAFEIKPIPAGASHALWVNGNVDQYGLTLAMPDFGPAKEVWMVAEFLEIGDPWDGTAQPRPILFHLQSDDGEVIVDVTSGTVTQNYDPASSQNGNVGSGDSYTVATSITGPSGIGLQEPLDIKDPHFGLLSTLSQRWALFASLASPGTLHVEYWNQYYGLQWEQFDVTGPLGDVGFSQASITVNAPLSSDRSFVLTNFARACGSRASNPFGMY